MTDDIGKVFSHLSVHSKHYLTPVNVVVVCVLRIRQGHRVNNVFADVNNASQMLV